MMQATLPPAWVDGELERFRRRRGRVSLAELGEMTARAHRLQQLQQLEPHRLQQLQQLELRRLRELRARLDWPRARPPPGVLLYTPDQLRQLIRLGNVAESAPATSSGPWRQGPLGAPWHLPDHEPSTEAARAAAEWSVWRAARGWALGALLLAAALLLLRATDRCFTTSYFRSRRRRSEEWPTPNVLATSNRNDEYALPPPNDFVGFASESSDSSADVFPADLPPPYSECASTPPHDPHDPHDPHKYTREEPPPPYSACYVAYSSPKDGTPSIRFLDDRQQELFREPPQDLFQETEHSSFDAQISIEELSQIAHSSNGFNHLDTGQSDNPIGDRIFKLPYFDNVDRETDDSDDCTGDCIANSLEGINIGPAPIASEDTSIDIVDDCTTDVENRNTREEIC